MDIDGLASNIKKLSIKIKEANHSNSKFSEKYQSFHKVFDENIGWYLIQGLLCIIVLLFDFWISENSMQYLSKLIRIKVQFIALVFTLVDGGIAILASGGLAGDNNLSRRNMRKTWQPILIVLGIVKIILFVFLIYSKYEDQLGMFQTIEVILPQVLFVIIIYFVLSKAGFGLWYILGKLYYGFWSLLLLDQNKLANEQNENCIDFQTLAHNQNIDPLTKARELGIIEIYNEYLVRQQNG